VVAEAGQARHQHLVLQHPFFASIDVQAAEKTATADALSAYGVIAAVQAAALGLVAPIHNAFVRQVPYEVIALRDAEAAVADLLAVGLDFAMLNAKLAAAVLAQTSGRLLAASETTLYLAQRG
jgi:hypothetical protein